MTQFPSPPPSSPFSAHRIKGVAFLRGGQGWYRPILTGALVVSLMVGGVTLALQEGGSPSSPASIAELSQRIDALEAAGHVTDERLALAEQALASLKSIGGVRTGEPATPQGAISVQLRESRLALALLQLRIASQTHLPFEPELTLVRHLERGETELSGVVATLEPYAAVGVATISELRDSFGLILLPKLQPLLEEGDQTWTDWAFSWLNVAVAPFTSSLVKPTPRQQLVISVVDRLTEDDLRGAVEQITKIDGPATAVVTRWLKEANARLVVNAAYNDLSGVVVALLSHTP
ncbi:hypothetical protein CCP3SC1_20002 [Gammaproteobacteria bacterium]